MSEGSIVMESRISARIPAELHEKVKAKSKETGVPIAFIIRKALEKWIENNTDNTKAGNR